LQSDLTSATGDILANANAITAVTTRVTTAEGTITSQGSSITTLISELNTAEADIAASSVVVSAIDVRVTANEGDIISSASDVTTLQTTVGGHTTSISTNASSITSVEGDVVDLLAEYVVKLDVDGKVAGFGITNDGGSSEFVIAADKFALYDASAAGGLETAFPFIVGPVGGVQRIS